MSITIKIGDSKAVLADGKWHGADALLVEMLNHHRSSLRVPGHYPPNDGELLTAQAAVRDFGGKIVARKLLPEDPSHSPDGRLIVY